jgi:hypothetical protein
MGLVCDVTVTNPANHRRRRRLAMAINPPSATDSKSLEPRAYEDLDKIFDTFFADRIMKGVLTK